MEQNENINVQNKDESTDKILNYSFSSASDIETFFEDFLKKGVVVDEKDIVEGFKVKLKVLNTEELLISEAILLSANPTIPIDVIEKIRAASILSQAIISINGIPIERDNLDKYENSKKRESLYKQILRMPAIVIQKTYQFYIDCVQRQNNIYINEGKIVDDIKNF